MEQYLPTFTDISNWQINVHLNTGGSRSKKIAINPETENEFFFKGSKELPTGEIRYPTEFWSEIVSSKIGQYLGFNMLDYNIGYNAYDKQQIGCLSKSMVEYSENKLTEGRAYLTGFDSKYNPITDKKDYTFQFICAALEWFELDDFIPELVEVIIFDALISNSDRHQENWGFITYFKETIEAINTSLRKDKLTFVKRFFIKLNRFVLKSINVSAERGTKNTLLLQSDLAKNEFSQIYDSGCCLGRENEDKVVKDLLNNEQRLEAYINKGFSEIYWEGYDKKRRHFELVELINGEYSERIKLVIGRIKEKYEQENIEKIIRNIDNSLPSNLLKYKLSNDRKELMIKIITLRFEKLLELG